MRFENRPSLVAARSTFRHLPIRGHVLFDTIGAILIQIVTDLEFPTLVYFGTWFAAHHHSRTINHHKVE